MIFTAVLKHIASRNADYGKAIKYLMYQHDEETGKAILDDQGRIVMRSEFYMDGINCDPMEFDHECEKTNAHFHKNQKYSEIKTHHYIISFDPKDVADHGLTGEHAQALCLDFAKKYFPGHQALVVTHTDGNHGSGNIHTHIVINSIRKADVPEEEFMERPCDHKAGYKHHLTKSYLKFLEKSVMEMCEREGLYQVDLLNPAAEKITQEEYWIKQHGQKKLDKLNQEIIADGLKPRNTEYKTQKQMLRDAIRDIASSASTMEEFKEQLWDKYEIELRTKCSQLGYKTKNRKKFITERSLGTHYGYEYISEKLEENRLKTSQYEADYHKNPYAIFYFKSELRLIVDLQNCVKEQNPYYAEKVKISNLQHMAETLIYVQDHNYDTRTQMQKKLATIRDQLENAQHKLSGLQAELTDINKQIHYTGQYYGNKKVYQEMLRSSDKGAFRKQHPAEIASFEEARKYLQQLTPDGAIPKIKELKSRKLQLQDLVSAQKSKVQELGNQEKELKTASENVDAILNSQPVVEQQKSHEEEIV